MRGPWKMKGPNVNKLPPDKTHGETWTREELDQMFDREFPVHSTRPVDSPKPVNDIFEQVNHPTHYNTLPVETIDSIKSHMQAEEFRGYLVGNVLKYVGRYQYKGMPLKDLNKAAWYLNKLIEEVGEDK